MLLFGLAIYIAVMAGFLLWDAKKGFGFEWDGETYPPLFLAATFWWITLPYVAMSAFVTQLDKAKQVRKEREEVRIRVKLADEKAIAAAMEEVELEVAEFDAKLKAGMHK